MDLSAFTEVTNKTAKDYLNGKVFGDVRLAMKELLDFIQTSGELEKYWSVMEKKNDEARRAARRIEKERKRLEMGSDYESSENEQSYKAGYVYDEYDDEQDKYEDEEYDEEDEEDESKDQNQTSSLENSIDKNRRPTGVQSPMLELPFNSVRYLGEALKAIAEQKKLGTIPPLKFK